MKLLIVGIGNPLKKDDNIGNIIAQELNKEYETLTAGTNPEAYLSKMKEYNRIIFIDAVDFQAKPGSVKKFKLKDIQDSLYATHNIPVSVLKKMLPDSEIEVIGIQPKDLGFGTELSLNLKNVINKVRELL